MQRFAGTACSMIVGVQQVAFQFVSVRELCPEKINSTKMSRAKLTHGIAAV